MVPRMHARACNRRYFAPEMVEGKPYGPASDAWAVGILAHEILTLHHPFSASGSLAQLLSRITDGQYDRSHLARAPYPEAIKAVASSVNLLHVDPVKRLTLPAMLEWPVFRVDDADTVAE